MPNLRMKFLNRALTGFAGAHESSEPPKNVLLIR